MEYKVNCGNYRHFIVTANSEKQARQRFQRAYNHDMMLTMGFQLKDVTSVVLNNPTSKEE